MSSTRTNATLAVLAVLVAATVIAFERMHSSVDTTLAAPSGDAETSHESDALVRVDRAGGDARDEAAAVSLREKADQPVPATADQLVTGSVLSASGLAIAGASVQGRAGGVVLATKTDRNGAFRLGPFENGDVEVRVEHAEHFGIGRRCRPGQQLHVRLEALGVIFGRVPTGDPNRRLTLEVSAGDDEGPWRVLESRVPVEDGSFRVAVRTVRFVRLVLTGANGPEGVSDPLVIEPASRRGPVMLHTPRAR